MKFRLAVTNEVTPDDLLVACGRLGLECLRLKRVGSGSVGGQPPTYQITLEVPDSALVQEGNDVAEEQVVEGQTPPAIPEKAPVAKDRKQRKGRLPNPEGTEA